MKNKLMIDMDTDREDVIRISKPEDVVETVDDPSKAKQMVLEDLTTVCNALGTLIHLADSNNYMDSKTATKMCIQFLQENFPNEGEPDRNEETK